MKNKKILGMGICALSLGMVAGVVGTRLAAVEAKADVAITGWDLAGSMNGWAGGEGYIFEHDNVNHVYSLTVDLAAGDTFKIRGNSNWKDCLLTWQFADELPGKIAKDVGDDKNDQIKDGCGGTYVFTINDSLTPTIAADSNQVHDYIDVRLQEDVMELRIVGAFDGSATSWDYLSSIPSAAKQDGNLYQYSGLEMKVGDQFKIATVNTTQQNVNWEAAKYGFANLDTESGAGANFIEGEDDKEQKNDNIKVKTAGIYDIVVSSTGVITVTLTPAAVTYTATLNGVNVPLQSIAPGHEDMAAQYQATITGNKGQEFKVYANDVLVTANINHDRGSSVAYDKNGVFNLRTNLNNGSVYIKVWKSGYVTVWGDNYADFSGYFLVSAASDWGANANAVLSDKDAESTSSNLAYFIGVDMAAGFEFTINNFDDGKRVNQFDYGWGAVDTNPEHSYAIDKFAKGEGEQNDHIKVVTAGTYDIYVTSEGKICLNAHGDPGSEETAKINALVSYIETKAAEEAWKTQDDPTRRAGCSEKYQGAVALYTALSESGQKYFRDNYSTLYAKMEYWHNAIENPGSLYNVSGLSENNPTLIITISVIGGAALAGAAFYLISKKRKHN